MPQGREGKRGADRAHDAHDAAKRLLRPHDQSELVAIGSLAHQRRGRRKQQRGPHRHENKEENEEWHGARRCEQARRQRHQRETEEQRDRADLHGADFPEARVEPANDRGAHDDAHHPEDREEVADGSGADRESVFQIQREHADHDVQCEHPDHVDPDHAMRRRGRLAHDLQERLPHRSALGHHEVSAGTARLRRSRFRQPFPREEHVDQDHHRRDEAGRLTAEVIRRRADEWADHDARAGRRR